jgi:ABC-type lipoprotein export system ATPase subunit
MIEVSHVSKVFNSGRKRVQALDEISLQIDEGDFALVKGPSGCGKSTLLFALGGLLNPSSGTICIAGKDLYMFSEKERNQYRSTKIAFVFQSYHLIPYLSILDNILLLNKIKGMRVVKDDVLTIAEKVNIHHRLDHKPSELSVGEKQRASLVRALVVNPQIILADEPTGNLDPENAMEVIKYLSEYHAKGGTVVMVTHGTDADACANMQIQMKNGQIVKS